MPFRQFYIFRLYCVISLANFRLCRTTGSPHIRLEQTTFIGRVLCFVSANFYYARGTRGLLVRGLEPKLRNRSEPARRSNIVTCHFIIFGGRSDPPRIYESQTSKISVTADRTFRAREK